MKTKKTLRDELAMSMPADSLPKLSDTRLIPEINERFGIDVDIKHESDLIIWHLKFVAIIRYIYADAMLEARGCL